MKFNVLSTLLTSAAFASLCRGASIIRRADAVPQACPDPRTAVPILRLYSPNTGDHFYTISASNAADAIANAGYVDEGTTGYCYATQQLGTTALYRHWSTSQQDHFYTTDGGSATNPPAGYTFERIECYVYATQECGGTPFWRLYNWSTAKHFYTGSTPDKDHVLTLGWTYEGNEGFVLPY